MATPRIFQLLETFLGDERTDELRKSAWNAFHKAKEALDKSKESASQATVDVTSAKQKEKETRKEFLRARVVSTPKIQKAVAREKAAGTRKRTAKRRFERMKSLFGPTNAATRHAQRQYQRTHKAHARAQERVERAKKPLDRAQRRYNQARVESEKTARRATDSARNVDRRRKEARRSIENLREFKSPQIRPGRFAGGFEGRHVAGAATAGMEQGGMMGSAIAGGKELMTGVAGGMALAFGGPYGPIIKKGIDMFSSLVDTGDRAVEAMHRFTEQTIEANLKLGYASPSMFAAGVQREWITGLEDMKRGEHLARDQVALNEQEKEKLRDNRMRDAVEQHQKNRDAMRSQMAEGTRGRVIGAIGEKHPHLARFLDRVGAGTAIEMGAHFATFFPALSREGSSVDRMHKRMDEADKQFEEEKRRIKQEVEIERASDKGTLNLENYFETVGRGSRFEEYINTTMDWAENVGLPGRHR